ncbi:MAG TPA: RsmB/NOP family class I SAM-dependent RNA methyltransferase [bacterium]|nr:RsmB/NOP family class I SAM-dependent RNA methyltransferase [bacterium]
MRSEVKRLPELFLERMRRLIPPQKWDGFANTFTETRPTTFRINTLKASRPVLKEKLEQSGFRIQNVSWYPEAFIMRGGTLRELQKTEAYLKGEIYVQGLASMLPPIVLDPQSGDLILDLTAAPGSKTTQLAAMMRGEGKIIANDNNKIRFFKLKANVELQGAANVTLSLKGGELFGREQPEKFDRILLDAPCSAEGRFNIHDPASYKFWKPAKIKEMARKQKMLFASAFHALRPGGVLVYSTCTFAPEENEAVLTWAMEKYRDRIRIEKIHLPLHNQTAGISQWENKLFDRAVRNAIRIMPNSEMEAFFIARLRKV